jgi:sec-independent protein translocase protein TatA
LTVGLPELLIVLAIVLLVLGPKRLPALGRSLGGGIRNLRSSWKGEDRAVEPPAVHEETEPLDGEVIRERRPSA